MSKFEFKNIENEHYNPGDTIAGEIIERYKSIFGENLLKVRTNKDYDVVIVESEWNIS